MKFTKLEIGISAIGLLFIIGGGFAAFAKLESRTTNLEKSVDPEEYGVLKEQIRNFKDIISAHDKHADDNRSLLQKIEVHLGKMDVKIERIQKDIEKLHEQP